MSIRPEMVKRLREKTGCGMMDCKEALSRTGGDMEKAVEFLRKKGMASAEKKAGRATRQGLVCTHVKDGKVGGMAEVNCETDFVARTEVFRDYVGGLARQMTERRAPDPESAKTVSAKVGENVQLGRSVCLGGGDPGALIGSYVHMGGRIGVLVELMSPAAAKDTPRELQELAEDLAMQIAAARPLYVRRGEVPAEVVAKEREIYRAQALESGKPEKVVDRIVEGKVEKYFAQVCLEEQEYIRESGVKVLSHIKAVAGKIGQDVAVRCFARFEMGQP